MKWVLRQDVPIDVFGLKTYLSDQSRKVKNGLPGDWVTDVLEKEESDGDHTYC